FHFAEMKLVADDYSFEFHISIIAVAVNNSRCTGDEVAFLFQIEFVMKNFDEGFLVPGILAALAAPFAVQVKLADLLRVEIICCWVFYSKSVCCEKENYE